jgi:selenocysteine-specific elongation factor
MAVVGTAGHVDHGKSTLVRALTGRDPDRWEEEKRRGLTIDLGFAWTRLPSGEEVSFVDVPGHERFIKNMLAGIEAIDIALLVVAADEGWRAQSEEHLAVLDLLEVGIGLVALTKIDRVEPELAELAAMEASEKLAGTRLSEVPVIPVSATVGTGLERIIAGLETAVVAAQRPLSGRSRLWVDRSFSISGAGTVVTGSLLDGPLSVGEQVEIWPERMTARIRSIQSHEQPQDTVGPNRRVALSLVGVERERVVRGSMLALPDQWRPTRRILAEVRPARYVERLSEKGAYHIHVGSGGWPVRMRLLEPDLALISLPGELCLQVGDRFILRETGRRAVVGGGRVLDPAAPASALANRKNAPRLGGIVDTSPDRRAEELLTVRGMAPLAELAAHSGGGRPSKARSVGEFAYSEEEWETLSARLIQAVDAYHLANPLRPGLTIASVASQWEAPPSLIEALATDLPELAVERGMVKVRSHRVTPDPAEEARWLAARARMETAGLTVPRLSELGIGGELLHALLREGHLIRIGDDLAYLPGQVDRLLELLAKMPGPFTVSEFKDAAGISRKYAVPFLEWADTAGHTVRRGDLRSFRAV